MKSLGLKKYKNAHPMSLSGGQNTPLVSEHFLLEKSAGTRYEHFIKDLAEADVRSVVCHLDMLHEHDIAFGADKSDILFVESITYSFYNDLFTPLIKDLPLDTAKKFAVTLTNFYNFGLMGIMGLKNGNS